MCAADLEKKEKNPSKASLLLQITKLLSNTKFLPTRSDKH